MGLGLGNGFYRVGPEFGLGWVAGFIGWAQFEDLEFLDFSVYLGLILMRLGLS